jgi:hypothetical protein
MLFHTGTGTDLLANLFLKLPKEQKNALFFLAQYDTTARDGVIRGIALVERTLDPFRRAFVNTDKQPSVFHRC